MVINGLDGFNIFWLVVEPTPLKNMSSSIGMMTFPISMEKKTMFQTTNRLFVTMDNDTI